VRFGPAAAECVVVPDVFVRAPRVGETHVAGGVHVLARLESHGAAPPPFHREAEQRRAVLREDVREYLRLRFAYRRRLEHLELADAGSWQRLDGAGRRRDHLHRQPAALIETGAVPTVRLARGVEVLPRVNVREGQRSRGPLPGRVRAHDHVLAVRHPDVHLEPEQERLPVREIRHGVRLDVAL
jgi:hypothetical protein